MFILQKADLLNNIFNINSSDC